MFDAELPRSFEQEDAKGITVSDVSNVDEMIDMKMAFDICNNDMKEQLNMEIPNGISLFLAEHILHNIFPQCDRDLLTEILKADYGNLKKSVEVVKEETGKSPNNNVLQMLENLMDKSDNLVQTPSASKSDLTPDLNHRNEYQRWSYEDAFKNALESRKQAKKQYELRKENVKKAAEARRKGHVDVAIHYSHLAQMHSRMMEMANYDAASAFLVAQVQMADRDNRLDLHNLFVAEALEALDVFIEYHLTKLDQENRSSINLYVITGRGARSNNGLSKIKPAVAGKLVARNIRFTHVNPGCLRIFLLSRQSPMTDLNYPFRPR